VTAVSPTSAYEVGGDVVTFTGCFNCSRTYSVTLGSRPCVSVSCDSSTSLHCTTTPMFVQNDTLVDAIITGIHLCKF